MSTPFDAELALLPAGGWMGLLADAALKGVVVLALAALAVRLLRSASAAARHLAWALGFAGVLALPLLGVLLPSWQVRVLPAAWVPVRMYDDAAGPLPAAAPGEPAPEAPAGARFAASEAGRPSPAIVSPVVMPGEPRRPFPWGALLLGAWLSGAGVVLAGLGVGMARVGAMGRRARPMADPRALMVARGAAARLGVRRPVTLLEGGELDMPLTWGVVRPRILLPAGAGEWPAERLEAVLVHEMAHVRRLDCLTQVVTEAACALHWFNPLAWAAARRLRLEGEHACDDHVLAAGARATDYADHLLHVARSLQRPRAVAMAAVAMARPSQLRTRLLALLSEGRRRGPVPARAAASALAAAAAVVLVLAAVTPTFAVRMTPVELFAAPEQCLEERPARRSHETDLTDGRVWEVSWSEGGCGGRARIEGRVDFNAARTDIVRIERGGSFMLELDDGQVRRRVTVRPGAGGRLERTMTVGGRAVAWDDHAGRWLAAALPGLLSRTLYLEGREETAEVRAPRRAEREDAADAVVELRLDGDEAEASTAAVPDAERVVGLTDAAVTSVAPVAPLGRGDAAAMRAHLAEVARLRSSGDRAAALRRAAPRLPADAEVHGAYLNVVAGLASSGDRRSTLGALMEHARLDERTWVRFLGRVRELPSSGDRRALLEEAAIRLPRSGLVSDAYLGAARELPSSSDRRAALAALALRRPGEDALVRILQISKEIGSSGERALLMEQVARVMGRGSRVVAVYRDAAAAIASPAERERALAAIGERPRREEPRRGVGAEVSQEGSESSTELTHSEDAKDGRPARRATLSARNVTLNAERTAIERIAPGGWAYFTEEEGGRRRSVRIVPASDGRLVKTYQGDFIDDRWLPSMIREFAGLTLGRRW